TNDAYWTGMNGQQAGYENIGLTERNGFPIITSGTQTGVQPLVRNDNNTREDKLFSAGWTNTISYDPWTLSLDLNYSRAEREQSQLET
ncbi:hypothetical protein, partial [Paraburkholderia sp. SIMBA_054]|uniref:hypothetical protein n=1 Tax=Paraburkholderia sp. SIMBA_054 TaxID=3085795 RepID=UPI0039781460